MRRVVYSCRAAYHEKVVELDQHGGALPPIPRCEVCGGSMYVSDDAVVEATTPLQRAHPHKRVGQWMKLEEVIALCDQHGLQTWGAAADSAHYTATTRRRWQGGLVLFYRPQVLKVLDRLKLEEVRAKLLGERR